MIKRIFGTRKRIIPMDEKDINRLAAEAEREIEGILQPQGGRLGTGAPPPPGRPVMRVLNPETRETPEPQLPQRTVSERLAEIHNKIDIVDAKVDLLLAILR